MTAKKYLTTNDIARMLQVSDPRTVKAFLAEKGVFPLRIGRLLRWDEEDVIVALAFMRQQDGKPEAKKRRPKRNAKRVLDMTAAELYAITSGANAPVQ